jgi:NAD+ synthase
MSKHLALALELKALARSRSEGLPEIRELAQRFASLPRYDSPEAFELIVSWTKARFRFAKVKRAVFGVSGGVDSSLTACVLAAALGPRNVTAYVLPCESQPEDEKDARLLCAALKIPVQRIDLTEPLAAMRKLVTPAKAPNADGNLKTRLRTMTLFHEAAAKNALYVGTGDLDEGFVGYYTKGSGADLSPLGSLHKSEVRRLVDFALGLKDRKLAKRLSSKPADAGLIKGRTAEADLGVTYAEMEGALEVIFETCALHDGGVVPREVDEFARVLERSGVSERVFRRVCELIYGARHKATGAPVLWRADTTHMSSQDFESE